MNKNLALIRAKLGSRAKLLAVSKNRSLDEIRDVYHEGQKDFGENQVGELFEKARDLAVSCPDLRWHMIGHIQSNKLGQLLKVPGLVSIHSVDSLKILKAIFAKKPMQKIGLFLQFNTSGEDEKGGFTDFQELKSAAELILKSDYYYWQGLMTIGRIRTDDFVADAHHSFALLNKLKTDLSYHFQIENIELSMGMSSDFELALEHGTNWVRIGTQIFGAR